MSEPKDRSPSYKWYHKNIEHAREYQRKWQKKNKKPLTEEQKTAKKEYLLKRLSTVEGHCKDIVPKLKKRRADTNVTWEHLVNLWNVQHGMCAITGKPMDIVKGNGRNLNSPSLDRIDNDQGYLVGNVRWVCDAANIMKSTMTDEELEEWCVSVVQGLRGQKTNYIPNLNTVGDLVDRLVVDVHKLAYWENLKRQEQSKDNPDTDLIAKADNLSRDCCEIRSALKTELNTVLSTIVNSKAYYPIKEIRTFTPAAEQVAEIIADVSFDSAMNTLKPEFIKAMTALLNEEEEKL